MDYSFVGYTQHELDLQYQNYCDHGSNTIINVDDGYEEKYLEDN